MKDDLTKEVAPEISFQRVDSYVHKAFEAARSELVQRIVLWDGAIVIYLASIGAYLNFTFNYHFSKEIGSLDITKSLALVTPLPFVCLIFTLIVLQHHIFIREIGIYISKELHWGPADSSISPHWDISNTARQLESRLFKVRKFTQAIILVLPMVYSLFVIYLLWSFHEKSTLEKVSLLIVAMLNLAIAIMIIWLHVVVDKQRRSAPKET